MKMRKKRLLRLLLSLVMVLALMVGFAPGMGMTAFADGVHTHNSITFTAWTSPNSLPTSGDYYLSVDVTISATTAISGTLNLCLNGHNITKTGEGRVFNVNKGNTLNIYDAEGTGVISGGLETNSNGGCVVLNSGTLNMYGGIMSGNKATRSGPGQGHGGAVHMGVGSTFNMYGGTITGNEAAWGAVSLVNGGNFTIYGGSIKGNTLNQTATGQIHTNAAGDGCVTIKGGIIASDNSYGCFFGGNTNLETYTISGSPSITTIWLANQNKLLKIDGQLGYTTPIGVKMTYPGVFTNSENTSYNDSSKFTSDNTGYAVGKNADGQLYLGTPVKVTYKVVNGTWSDGTTADKTETVASGSTPASVPTGMKASEGYKGGAWDTNPADATITEATTFTYTFEAKPAALVTKAPEAKALTSNGSVRELVTPGQASGGNMYYVLGTDTTTAPTEGWTTSIPTATEAGTYYVWYKVVGDADHLDVDPACVTVTIVEPSSSVDLTLGDDTTNVAVTGLDALAEESKEAGKTVVVTMTVDKKDKTEVEAADSAAIETAAEGMRLEYIDISLTKTVDGTESPLTDTSTVLEIIVPYDFSKKMQTTVKVYRYHGTSAAALTEATTKADGTYRLDRENNLVYIYANQFSTYAIGFTPTYTVSGTLDFGSFTGTVSFSLTGNGVTKTASSTVTNGSGSYSFTGVPAGTYDVTASWSKGGKAHTLMFTVTVPAGTP